MPAAPTVLQFKITLNGIRPPIWRRIQVPAAYDFWGLHVAIQDAMGWQDYHLHQFRLQSARGKEMRIGIPDDEGFDDEMPETLAGWEVPLSRFFKDVPVTGRYDYDFGDGWTHEIVFEGRVPRTPRVPYPQCIEGARACPPEDCGGPHGYQAMLQILANPRHPEHEEMVLWSGGQYDPEKFDASAVRFDKPRVRWRISFGDEEGL